MEVDNGTGWRIMVGVEGNGVDEAAAPNGWAIVL